MFHLSPFLSAYPKPFNLTTKDKHKETQQTELCNCLPKQSAHAAGQSQGGRGVVCFN